MAVIKDFRDLLVWQKAIALGKDVYQLSSRFPREEMFGLTSQLRRSAVSVSSNIAEGHSRRDDSFGNFLSIAVGSAGEAQSQLILAGELRFASPEEVQRLFEMGQEIRRMGYSLIDKVRGK